MWNAKLDESQAGVKTAGRYINNLRYVDDTTVMKKQRGTKEPSWWRLKRRVKKDSLKHNTQNMQIMTSGPIALWQIEREKVEAVTDFIFLGSKFTETVTAAMKLKDACSLEEKLWQT